MSMAEIVFYSLGLHHSGRSITYEQYLKAKSIVERGLDLTWEEMGE